MMILIIILYVRTMYWWLFLEINWQDEKGELIKYHFLSDRYEFVCIAIKTSCITGVQAAKRNSWNTLHGSSTPTLNHVKLLGSSRKFQSHPPSALLLLWRLGIIQVLPLKCDLLKNHFIIRLRIRTGKQILVVISTRFRTLKLPAFIDRIQRPKHCGYSNEEIPSWNIKAYSNNSFLHKLNQKVFLMPCPIMCQTIPLVRILLLHL